MTRFTSMIRTGDDHSVTSVSNMTWLAQGKTRVATLWKRAMPLLALSLAFGVHVAPATATDPANFGWNVTVTVPPGVNPNDFHAIFTGTGGSIKNAVMVVDPLPPAVINGTSNMVNITWTGNLAPGTVFKFFFTTAFSPVDFGGGNWTKNGNTIGEVNGNSVIIEETAPNCIIPGCPGDTDRNGTVNVVDLVNVINQWNTDGLGVPGITADTNCDGIVDVLDLVQGIINNWGPCPVFIVACCFSDGGCAELANVDCVANGGVPSGFNCATTVCPAPGPANDDCANRIDVPPGTTPFSTVGATTDGPDHVGCLAFGDSGVQSDIWFNHVANASGPLQIDTCGSGYDTKLAVYDGCDCTQINDDTLLACNDDACSLQSEVTINAIAGNCYKIRVGGFDGAQGDGILTITPTATQVTCASSAIIVMEEGVGRPIFDAIPNGALLFTANIVGRSGFVGPCLPPPLEAGGGATTERYTVEGNNLQQVSNAIFNAATGQGELIDGRRYAGSATLGLDPQYDIMVAEGGESLCVQLVSLGWTTTIRLPNWTRPDGTPAAQVEEWNRFRMALNVHEMGHAMINDANMPMVRDRLVNTEAGKVIVPGTAIPTYNDDNQPATPEDQVRAR